MRNVQRFQIPQLFQCPRLDLADIVVRDVEANRRRKPRKRGANLLDRPVGKRHGQERLDVPIGHVQHQLPHGDVPHVDVPPGRSFRSTTVGGACDRLVDVGHVATVHSSGDQWIRTAFALAGPVVTQFRGGIVAAEFVGGRNQRRRGRWDGRR